MTANGPEDEWPERSRRERVSRFVEHRLINPVMRALLRLGLSPRAFALLETIGRRSGRPRQTPVGNGLDGRVFWLVSGHGRRSDYVQNLLAHPRVRVKVGRHWHSGSATLLPGDDGRRRRQVLDRANGIIGRLDGMVWAATATEPCTIRIDLTDDDISDG